MNNTVRTKFLSHTPSIGTFTHLKSMAAVEAIGATGLDYVIFDTEHAAVTADEVSRLTASAEAAGITPFARVQDGSRSSLLRALDAGVMGLIVPCMETVEEIRQLVRWSKFYPLGRRGFSVSRDCRWGYADNFQGGMDAYMAEANRDTLLIPQCETAGCLAHIEEIAAIDGVDGIMVGPFDLSIALGMPGQFDRPEFAAAVERILQACKASGKLSMIFTGDAAAARQRIDQGFDTVIVGLDAAFLAESYRGLLARLRP